MEELTLQDLMIINKGVLRPGEPFAILDQGRLESALGNQYYGYLYGSDEQAIAALYRAIVINHGFANGNKRTAVVAAKFLADSIGAKFALDDQGLIDFTYEIASDGGSRLDTNYITNKLFGTNLEVNEGLDKLVKVYTYQGSEVVDILNSGTTYYADYNKGIFKNATDNPYRHLAKALSLSNCPIFASTSKAKLDYMMEASGLDGEYTLLTLNVPRSEIKMTDYYDWTDYIYYYVDQEEDIEMSKEEYEDYLRSKMTKLKGFTYPQVILDRIEPDWVISKSLMEDAKAGDKLTIKNIQNWLKTNGATISCEDKCAVVYTEGYELSFDGTEIQIPGLDFDDREDLELVKATLDKRVEEAMYPYVGLWVDNGIVYIDYSEHILDRKEAFESGIDSNQLSMFNWGYPNNGDPQYINLVELRKAPLTESAGTDLCKDMAIHLNYEVEALLKDCNVDRDELDYYLRKEAAKIVTIVENVIENFNYEYVPDEAARKVVIVKICGGTPCIEIETKDGLYYAMDKLEFKKALTKALHAYDCTLDKVSIGTIFKHEFGYVFYMDIYIMKKVIDEFIEEYSNKDVVLEGK